MALSSGSAFAAGFIRRQDAEEARRKAETEQQRRVANEEESLAYARKQRPEQERARKAQTDAAEATASRARATADREAKDAAAKARTEGLDGLLDDLEAGADVGTAVARYNSRRGTHRLDPARVQHDLATKRIVIDDPVEGKIDTTTDILRAGIDSDMERGTAGVVTAEGLVHPKTGRLMRKNPAKPEEEYEGQVRYRGNKVIGRGPPKPPKNAPGPKGGPTEKTGPGGQKLTTFNPATWEKDVHTSLGEALGGKFDAKNGTFVPKEGTSHTVLERRSLANRLGKRINYALDPATVAQIVNDGFADAKTEDEFAAEMESAAPPAKDEWLGFATSEHAREVARTNARKAAKSAYQRDQATRMKAIEKAVDDAVAMETRAGSQAAGVEDGDGADTEGATETANEANPNDNVPAAPAAAAGAPAAPRRYVMTDPKTKKQVHLDVTDGLTKRLQSLPPGARLPDPRVPGLTWVLGPDGTPRPQ